MDEDIKQLLEKNLELNQEIYKISKRLNSFMVWMTVFNALKVLIIAVPIILGIIYLPDLIQSFTGQMDAFMNNPANPSNLSPLMMELLTN